MGMQIPHSYQQPATVTSSLLLYEMPWAKNVPDRVLDVVMSVARTEGPVEGGLVTCRMSTFLMPIVAGQSRGGLNFEGSLNQVHQAYRHVFSEGVSRNLFEGNIAVHQAHQAMQSIAENVEMILGADEKPKVAAYGPDETAPRETPLLITSDKLYIPGHLSGHDDFAARRGPSFDYYRQDWAKGLDHAESFFTAEEDEDEMFQAVMQKLRENAHDAVYPGMFFAEHRLAQLDEKQAIGSRDVWQIGMCEPHHVEYLMWTDSEEEAHVALSILNDGFLYEAVETDPRQKMLRQFNTLHYDAVCGQKTTYLQGVTKSHLMDYLKRGNSLS